jgi:hypothetical protein
MMQEIEIALDPGSGIAGNILHVSNIVPSNPAIRKDGQVKCFGLELTEHFSDFWVMN